jgi:Zn-dependent peptidase ImmA (M78 family)
MAAVTVPVNPAVLAWARESLGISTEEAAARIKQGEDVIHAWESGTSQPTLGPLRDLAILYRRPIATFLLPAVPKSPPRPADRRVAAGKERGPLSRKTLEALERAFQYRAIAAELESEPSQVVSPAVLNAALTSPYEAAVVARADLGITTERQFAWKNNRQALNAWRDVLEKRGVLVFAMTMPPTEVRGLSISGPDGPPAIVLSSGDSDTAKMFSLFHEYGHVLMGASGICLPYEGPQRQSLSEVELYSNRFSGALLVPGDALAVMPGVQALGSSATMPLDGDIEAVADKFRVSKQVLWYRLRDLEIISRQRFAAKWASWRHWKPPKGRGRTPRVGIRVLNRRGLRFTGLVFDARTEAAITTNDALAYLAIQLSDLDEVEAELRRRANG